jgi:HAD superfamily hydrolase (TIGR01509 family)
VARFFTAHGAPHSAGEVLDRYTGLANPVMIQRVERECGVQFPAGFLHEMEQAELAALMRDLRPVSGMAALLDSIAARPKCVASSSTPERIARSLEVAGLAHHFGAQVFSASMVAQPKPAPDLFLHAAASMGYAPSDCVVVEDSVFGVQGAVAAGMRTIGFTAAAHDVADVGARLLAAGADRIAADAMQLASVLAA